MLDIVRPTAAIGLLVFTAERRIHMSNDLARRAAIQRANQVFRGELWQPSSTEQASCF